MTVGFIGLGTMGRPMAGHLGRRGYRLALYARRPEVLDPLVREGATRYGSPAEVAAVSDIVITMVTATGDVEEVLFGREGVAGAAKPGTLVIDMSTIAPAAARDFAVRLAVDGVDMLDAPVSGGPKGALGASLTIMVGGPDEAFERARPLFECLGKTIVRVGGQGAGQIAKACHQLLLVVTAQGVAEALSLARGCGVDPAVVHRIMMSGIATGGVLELFGGRMVARQFEAGIPVRLYRKDLDIVAALARAAGADVPAGGVVLDRLVRLASAGRGDADLSALITLLEEAGAGAE